MSEKEIKKLVATCLYLELKIFQYELLSKSKREIYDASYKIEIMAIIYEILIEQLEEMKEEIVHHLILWKGNLMEDIYSRWLKKEDSSYEELKLHVEEHLKTIYSGKFLNDRKEKYHGKRMDKAA